MGATPTRSSDPPPHRDALEDTVPASEPATEEGPPVRPTVPIDRYRIGNELGRGGMGRVVEAFDVQLGRTVALKEVLPKTGGGTARRFNREIQITARLEHASIVPLYDSGINRDGKPFYVMRRVTGRPLDQTIVRCRDLDERLTLLPAVLAAIDAVAHAHKRGVIHRDLKPANILLGELGETVVIDWGLAKVVGEADDLSDGPMTSGDSLQTQMGSVFGTPGFMAPEQARGEALHLHGDVYALGAVLYQLLAGAPPVAGVSATEVMDKTRTHDIIPLAQAAPGAPPDLVAIVGKALAFDPSGRYPDAGALGEDVRRFLAGQLVAAHDYTNRQKLARFARRHRGALAVAALAAVAVAVMSWIGVHRIVTERDAANLARGEADAGKRDAETSRDRLAERADALVVMQARALIESSPTEAIAILKQLSSKSPRIDEARGLAQAAAVRGITWAVQSTNEFSPIAALDPEGRHLLQVSRDGMVRVFDLDRRRLLVARPFAPMTRAEWVAGGKLLVSHAKSPPQLFDPSANTVEALALEPVSFAAATVTGDRLVIQTPAKTAGVLDLATRTIVPLPFAEPVEATSIAHDGSWVAVAGRTLVVVFDREGKELTRHVGPVARVIGSRFRSLAVMVDPLHVIECKLDPQPVWREVSITSQAPHRVIDMVYRGRELDLYMSNADLMAWTGTTLFQRNHVERLAFLAQEAGHETVIIPSADGKLHWANELGRGALTLPGVVNRMRVAARAGSSRVAVVGDGIVIVFDLGAVVPQSIPAKPFTRAFFIDDDTVLVMSSIDERWHWLDLATGKSTSIDFDERGMPAVWDVDLQSGRVLVREHTPNGMRFVLLRKGSLTVEVVAEGGRDLWARLIPGDAVIYSLGDGRVFARIGVEPAAQVAKLDGVVHHGVGIGRLQYAAHSSTGEVVRGDLATGKLERIRVPVGANGFLASDGNGRVLMIEDNRLLAWDGAVTEIAKFDKSIARITPVHGGVAIHLGNDNELHILELRPGATPHRVLASSAEVPSVSLDGKLLVGLGSGHNVTIVELPSRARWSLPVLYSAQASLGVAPTSRKILQSTERALAIWHLPHVGTDFAAWLDRQTNATVDADGVLAWPWQVRHTP